MSASARERTESRLLAKVGSTFSDEEVFAEGTKWSQRTFFYKNATESIKAGKPLAASIYYHKNGRGLVSVFSNFWSGRARVVQVDKTGKLSFAKSKVKSTDSKKVENAVDKGKSLADAFEVLRNTAFIEANRGELIVFGSKNATALNGGKEIEKGYYLVGGSRKSQTKSSAETLAKLLTEKRKEIAELEKKLEAASKAERNEAQTKSSNSRIIRSQK